MGHTHCKELAPDGRTLYSTARSVGQNKDGPAGYAIAAIDETSVHGLVTSWRFKQVQLGSPFVLITSPKDGRLAPGVFELAVRWPAGSRTVSVDVQDGRTFGRDFLDMDTIEPVSLDYRPPIRPLTIGSNAQAIKGWPAKGVRGDQLGPNSGGHKW